MHFVFLLGGEDYERKVRGELNQIRTTPVGQFLVDTLEASKFNITITPRNPDLKPGAETEPEDDNAMKRCDRSLQSHPNSRRSHLLSLIGNTAVGDWLLEYFPVGRKEGFRPGSGAGSSIYFDPDLSASNVRTTTGNTTPPVIVLAHELAHAFHFIHGVGSRCRQEEELAASRYENAIRRGLGLGQRLSYGSWHISPVFGETFSR
jgi:hypothetical protein